MRPEPRVRVPCEPHRSMNEVGPRTQREDPGSEHPAPAEARIVDELVRHAAVLDHVRVRLRVGDPDPAVLGGGGCDSGGTPCGCASWSGGGGGGGGGGAAIAGAASNRADSTIDVFIVLSFGGV